MDKTYRFSNFHTHCYLDDGQESLEAYVLKALSLNFNALGFSCHAPVPFDDEGHLRSEDFDSYLKTIYELKAAYKDRIEIYAGLELDYLEQSNEMAGSEYVDRLDFTIGSLHVMYCNDEFGYLSIDYRPEDFEKILDCRFSGNIKDMVSHFWHLQTLMVEQHRFSFFGHCDAIKKLNEGNRYFNAQEAWYQELVAPFLQSLARNHVRMEVNTGGLARGKTNETYPSNSIIRQAVALGIPLLLSSDAHQSETLDFYFQQAHDEIIQAGAKSLDTLYHGLWIKRPIV